MRAKCDHVYKALRIVPGRNKGNTSTGGWRKKGGDGGVGVGREGKKKKQDSTWHVVSVPLSISGRSFYLNHFLIVETVLYVLES